MSANGKATELTQGHVLHWPGRVVTALDLQRQLNGHREIIVPARAVFTPSAAEHLREKGIRITRQQADAKDKKTSTAKPWGFAQDRPHAAVRIALQALAREGVMVQELTTDRGSDPCGWARGLAECIARGECQGGVLFCEDPGLVCCVANKLAGLRAVAIVTISQAARASLTLGVNLAAVEMPGRTDFELRQILRTLCVPGAITCPEGVASMLKELDGHAHR